MAYEFSLVLDHEPSDDELDALFVAGCADAIFEGFTGESIAHFDRESDSLASAISSAVHNIETAGFTCSEVRPHELADPHRRDDYLREIAAANMMVQTRAFLAGR